jgi:hypothetical protein
VLKKKMLPNFLRIIEFFTQNIAKQLSKIWVWDPGSKIRNTEKTYSGSRGQKGTGSRIPEPDPHVDRHRFDANPGLDPHQNGNLYCRIVGSKRCRSTKLKKTQ